MSSYPKTTISVINIRAPVFNTDELRKTGSIASPLILSSLASMGISLTDVVMMGWLGTLALGSGAVASDLFSIFFYFGAAVVSAASPMIAQARGRDDLPGIREALQQSVWIAGLLGMAMASVVWHADLLLTWLHVQADVVAMGAPYARMMAIALPILLFDTVWRNFLVAHEMSRVLFYVNLIALPVNALGNYLLMFGKFGFPEMGLAGAGLASIVTAIAMLAMLTVYALTRREFSHYALFNGFFRRHWRRFHEILRVGIPMGFHSLGEVGVFLLSTVIMGIFGANAVAAHAVALRVSGILYAIPVGLSQAATVRVGFTVGTSDITAMQRAIWTCFGLSLVAGIAYLIIIQLFGESIVSLFIEAVPDTQEVFALAVLLLTIVGLMQPFECGAVVVPGILRGFKDTHVPMLYALLCYWLIGLGTGLILSFGFNLGGLGLWIGLALGSITLALLLSIRLIRFRYDFHRHTKTVSTGGKLNDP